MNRSFEIDSDCLDVVSRIKQIDKDYFVKFNLDTKQFELHNGEQFGSTYCLTFPFDTLDERCIDFTLKTRAVNCDELFAELDRENEQLEKRQVKEVLNDFEEKLYDS